MAKLHFDCFAYIILHISERNDQTVINLAKQGLDSWSTKTFLHVGRWYQPSRVCCVMPRQAVWAWAELREPEHSRAHGWGSRGKRGFVAACQLTASAESGGICLGVRQGWLPSACKCCTDLQSSGHELLKIIEKSVRALICQELTLQVCPTVTLFPTPGSIFLTSEYKHWVREKLF